MGLREDIADVLHDFYIDASTRKITREEFEAFIDRIVALLGEADGTSADRTSGDETATGKDE